MSKKLKSLNNIASPLEWEILQEKDVYDFLAKDPDSLKKKDETNALPLHYSVISGANLNVVKLIYYLYPEAINVKSESYLPIHFAADDPKRHYLVLFLAQVNPESLLEKDNKNRTPIDLILYEKNYVLANKLYKLFYYYSIKKKFG